MVGDTGIEPVTPSMSTKCSTAELITLKGVREHPSTSSRCSIKGMSGGFKSFGTGNFQSITLSMTADAYSERLPKAVTTSVVFASPHSGRSYPPKFMAESILDELTLRSSEDAFIDDLIDSAPNLGAQSLLATYPRAYVDLNRAATELDPAVLAGFRRAIIINPRIASGLGVIPRVVSNGRAIYYGKIPLAEGKKRLEAVWHPYHNRLDAMLKQTKQQFGQAILVDCHSMPHEALDLHRPAGHPRPDIVLGDRFGSSASNDIVEGIAAAFQAAGFVVSRNAPFAGAYICQRYGKPTRGIHAVQIEIDRALYMDERTITPNPNYDRFKQVLAGVMADIAELGRAQARLAAE